MNSVLQMLYTIKPLRSDLLDNPDKCAGFKTSLFNLRRLFGLMSTMVTESAEILQTERVYVNPVAFRRTMPPFFQGYTQQDASEYMRVLFDKMENEQLTDAFKAEYSAKKQLFANRHLMGQQVQEITCEQCQTVSSRPLEYIDFGLSLDADVPKKTVQSLLDAVFTKEELNEKNGN